MINTITAAAVDLSRWTPVDLLIKSTLCLILGLACWQLARRSAASMRHLLLAATFAALLILPFIVTSAPQIHLRVPMAAAGKAAASHFSTPYTAPLKGGAQIASSQVVPAIVLPSWRTIFTAVWSIGAVLMLLVATVDLWRLRRLRRSGFPALELSSRLEKLAEEAGIRRHVELLVLPEIQSPLTSGFIRPAIMLPDDARSWNDENLSRALVHELEHVRRADWIVQLLALATCSLYWFHPLAWSAWRKLCLEAERACDDAVLRREESPAYAEQLVSLARRMTHQSEVRALGMARRSDLSERVHAVLDARQSRQAVGAAAAAVAVVTVSLFALTIGSVRAVAQSVGGESQSAGPLDKALFEAAQKGDTSAVERLIGSGANVNAKLQGDGTPLIAAAREGSDKTINLLLDRGADPNIGIRGDGSPLIAASEHGRLSTVRLLLDRGADVRMPVTGDGNPLIMAARGGSVEVVELLLSRGADIEQVVPGDENALIEASASGQLPVVKLLVRRGANVNARVWVESPAEWRTPLKMAVRNRHSAVVEYLRSVGASE